MKMMKYKIGDEVLLRVKITNVEKHYYEGTSGEEDDWSFLENKIYSLAPEFNPGEEIEVSNSPKGDWLYKTYLGVNPFNHIFPVAASKDGQAGSYKYARKIQPKEEVKPDKLVTIDGQKYKLTKVEE